MSGLENNYDSNDSFISKMKKKWSELPTIIKIIIVFALIVIIVLLIVYWIMKSKKNDKKERTTDSGGTKEGFTTAGDDLTVNDYVNSYIESTRGELIGDNAL